MRARLLRWMLQGGLLVLALAVALLIGEGVARVALNPSDFLIVHPVRDTILGQRLAPGASGHDRWGFRNPRVPDSAEVVTIGDSQTYGVGLPRRSSWPAQLSKLTGRSLYNASLPSYSPVQYHELLRRYALPLRPRAVIVGFYFGNDLLESYRIVYGLRHYTALRRPNMPPPNTLRRASKARGLSARARRWLSAHSVLYRATIAVLGGRAQRAELVFLDADKELVRFNHGHTSTVFTPAYRLRSLDLSAKVVREGLRLSRLELQEMARLCDSAGVALTIALIPTKERVYQPLIEADPVVSRNAELRRMLANEAEANQEIRASLDEKGIHYVDLLSPLREVVGRTAIYAPDDDGHPTAAGYAVIARALSRAMQPPGRATPPASATRTAPAG
ncbi:MAG TPA: SGNH/GDSL hydrolase family protein [Gemmatimonadales bacterium]|nr:SGNH/GDSL hydrolase family protein [Gemmatimonadales bacterium]